MTALPSRPSLGRRERWLAVAVLFVAWEGAAIKLGCAPPPDHVALALMSVVSFIGLETYRPSGTSRAAE